MLPLTEKLLIEREEIQEVRLSIIDELIVQLNNESADTTHLESNLRSGWNAIHQRIPLAAETIASVHAILTEEQRAEIVEKWNAAKTGGKNAVNAVGIIGTERGNNDIILYFIRNIPLDLHPILIHFPIAFLGFSFVLSFLVYAGFQME